jgi:hypothetical protein
VNSRLSPNAAALHKDKIAPHVILNKWRTAEKENIKLLKNDLLINLGARPARPAIQSQVETLK